MSHIAPTSIINSPPIFVEQIIPGHISQGSQILQSSQVIQQAPQIIQQTSQISYQQPGIPPIVKGKPPRPISASKTFAPPEVVPYQIVEAVNELRRSRSR
jgi:hypothetical protein